MTECNMLELLALVVIVTSPANKVTAEPVLVPVSVFVTWLTAVPVWVLSAPATVGVSAVTCTSLIKGLEVV